jgi:hypothetical protein
MSIADRAKSLYERQWKAKLESEHRDQFIAIEPLSKSYYLGDTFMDAAMAAKSAYPDRKSFVLRIGHEAAFHIGSSAR